MMALTNPVTRPARFSAGNLESKAYVSLEVFASTIDTLLTNWGDAARSFECVT